jgi:DNA-binding CsgD family transcriptional regulator
MNGADPTSLLEREQELAALESLVDAALTGEAAVGLIEGAAGIGKSRLLNEARGRATAGGLRTLSARGGQLERDFPFGVVRQLFEPLLVGSDGSMFTGAADAARAVFELSPDRDDDADPSFASMHGLYWLTVNFSVDGPVLLAVDDLHWCDRASLRFLAYLIRRLEGLPVLVLSTLRTAEPGVDVALVGEIAGDPLTIEIRPRPLSVDAAAALVHKRLGGDAAPAFSAACHAATGGNPLLLEELLKALAVEGVQPDAAHIGVVTELGPAAVSRAVLLRLRQLPADAVKLATAVAVLGDGADPEMATVLAGLTTNDAASAATALVQAEILQPGAAAAFVHPLVGAAIYSELPPLARAAQHEHAAALLSAIGAPAEKIAVHLEMVPARGEPSVVETLQRAARAALQKGAAESAVGFLGRALAEPPPPEQRAAVLLEFGRAETLTSGPAAAEHLTEAYTMLDEPLARAATAHELARALLLTGHPDEGASIAREAAAELPQELEDARLGLEAFGFLAILFGAGDPSALRRLAEYRNVPVAPGVGAKMLAAVAAQEWVYACGPSDACAELSLAALADGDLIAVDNGLLATCAITNLVFADREEAMDAWELARADAHDRGSLFAISSLDLWFGFTLYWRGDLADAEASLRSALDDFQLWGHGRDQAQIYCDAFLSAVLRERGDLTAARTALEQSDDTGGDDDGTRYWLNSQVELLLAEGRFDDALEVVDDYARRFGALIRNPMDAPWRSHKAMALHALDRADEARPLVEEELELAREWGAPGTVARSLRALARATPSEEVALLREAVEIVGDSPARLEAAKSLSALGSALRRARQPSEAREPLRRALELAVACGAGPVEEHARSELYAAGGRPRAAALTGPGSLTASERRVAGLAAEGAGNRDIAQALFVTPKTVEAHLSSAYRKLGIRSRHELSAALVIDG